MVANTHLAFIIEAAQLANPRALVETCCMNVVFFVLYFSGEKNKLINGKIKVEEQLESEHKNILKLTASLNELLLANVSINNELTLIVKNISVTQETT